MASIRRELLIDAPAATIWDAMRDVGAVHLRLASGFVTDTRLDGDSRIVTFANGMVVRELIVAVDDEQQRLAYAIVEGAPRHYHASLQVFQTSESLSRVVWIIDLLPADMAAAVAGMMDLGMAAMSRTLEGIRLVQHEKLARVHLGRRI